MSEIQVGDKVTIRFLQSSPTQIRNTNQEYTVVTIPGNQNLDVRFWELSRAGDLYIIDMPVIMRKVDGAP